MAEAIIKLLFRPGAHDSSFFDPSADTQLQGSIPNSAGALNTRGGNFFCDFRLKSPFISQTVRDRLMVDETLI